MPPNRSFGGGTPWELPGVADGLNLFTMVHNNSVAHVDQQIRRF